MRTAAVDVAAEVVADDADADDRPRLEPPAARCLAHSSLEPGGDVLLDAGRRHPAVKDQRLHGRALEDRQDVDRDRVGRQPAQHDQRQHHHRHGDRVLQGSVDQAVHRSGFPRDQQSYSGVRTHPGMTRLGAIRTCGTSTTATRMPSSSGVPDGNDDRVVRADSGADLGVRSRCRRPA